MSAAESLTNKVNFAFFQPLSGLSDSFRLIVCKIEVTYDYLGVKLLRVDLILRELGNSSTFVHAERSRLLTLINFKTLLLLSKNQANTYLRLRAAFVYELLAVVVH